MTLDTFVSFLSISLKDLLTVARNTCTQLTTTKASAPPCNHIHNHKHTFEQVFKHTNTHGNTHTSAHLSLGVPAVGEQHFIRAAAG